MEVPILTSDLGARIVQAENAVTLSRLRSVQKLAGNPLGAESREFGHVLATLMRNHPERWWNRVGGIAASDENLLDEILAWYREFRIQPSFDIVPPQSSEDLLRALAARGFFQSGFRDVLYGVPDTNQPAPAEGIAVQQQSDLRIFCDIAFENGFIPKGDKRFWSEVTRAQLADSQCYLALVDGAPAAHAVMSIQDGVASLGFGATLEKYRGRGCQSALLRTRIADAARARCDLVVVQANPGSASQRNVERAGLRVAYTKAIWTARG